MLSTATTPSETIYYFLHSRVFQSGQSPYTALLTMQAEVVKIMKRRIFELDKAFDTVNHKILLKNYMTMA